MRGNVSKTIKDTMSMTDRDYVMKASKVVNEDIPKIYETKTDAETKFAETKKYADNKVAELVNSAPETLDTLSELSKALGDDENFAANVLGQIGKVRDDVKSIKNIAVLAEDANLTYLDDGLYHLPCGHNSFSELLGHNFPHTLYQTTSGRLGYAVQILMCPDSIMWRGLADSFMPEYVAPPWKKLSFNVINDLTTADSNNPLSAKQGVELNNKIVDANNEIDDINNKIKFTRLVFDSIVDDLSDGNYYTEPYKPIEKVIDYTFDNPSTCETERAYICRAGEIIADSDSSVPRGNGGNVLCIPNGVSNKEQYMFIDDGDNWYSHGEDIVQRFEDGVLEFDMCACGFASEKEFFMISPQHKGDRIGIAFVKNPSGDGILVRMPQSAYAYSGTSTEFVVEDATWHNYKIEYKSSANRVNYYIDNVLIYSKTDYKGVVGADEVTIYKYMPKYFSLYANTADDGGGEILIDSVMIYNTTGIENLGIDNQYVLCQKSVGINSVQFKITTTDDNIVCSKRTKSLYGDWGRWIDDVALDETGKVPVDKLPNIPLGLLPNMPIHFGKMNTEAMTLTELPDNSLILLYASDPITVTVTGMSATTIESNVIILWTGGQGDDVSYPNFRRTNIMYMDKSILSTPAFDFNNAVTKVYGNPGMATISISCPANTYKGWIGNEE